MIEKIQSQENVYSKNFLEKGLKGGEISQEEFENILEFLGAENINDSKLGKKVNDMQKKYPQRFRNPDGDFWPQTLTIVRDLLKQKAQQSQIREDVEEQQGDTFTFENGDKYRWNIVEGVRQGFGIYTYKNGISIRGGWENDVCKKGIISYPNGTRIDAEHIESISPLTVRGKMIQSGKIVYEWDIVNGKQSGNGTYYDEKNGTYTGEWLDGDQHGRWTLTLPKGHTISGTWEKGKLAGIGTLTRANGSTARVRMNNNGKLVLAG